jgi:dihydroxyacid dehydratase/phosphogluconate dehydratase
MSFLREEFVGKTVIGIINNSNKMSSFHTHFLERVKDVKRGFFPTGGFPVGLPTISLGELLMEPIAMVHLEPS